MKALFLCGGVGKRMFPLTKDKFLLNFLGKTLLEHQIETARLGGLTDFIIVANPGNRERIEEITDEVHGVKFLIAVQEKPLGIANAIETARRYLDDEVIIINPNDIFESSAYTLLMEAKQTGDGIAYLLAQEVRDYFPGGYLVVDRKGMLQRIIEKPGKGYGPSTLVNLLVHLHTDPAKLLTAIKNTPAGSDDVYEQAIGSLAPTAKVKAIRYPGPWTAIKYPWHILDAVKYFLDNRQGYISPSASISPSATIDGRVIIAENVRVLENAVVRGPAYIGKNTVIGNNSLVRDYSHIGDGCIIGFSTEIKGSYLGDGCRTHMNYIGDSVIGEDCSFGAGTVTANWRLDGKKVQVRIEGKPVDTGREKFGAIIGDNCRTGVNVGIMPGIKIGQDAIIGPGVVVTADMTPGERWLTGHTIHGRKN